MKELKQEIINQARSWIGTNFKYQGRLKKDLHCNGGCDCLGLIIGIARELNLVSKEGNFLSIYDKRNYDKLLKNVDLAQEFDKHFFHVKNLEIADILLFKINGKVQHIGILSQFNNHKTLIHSYIQAKSIVEHHLNDLWSKRIYKAYRFADLFI